MSHTFGYLLHPFRGSKLVPKVDEQRALLRAHAARSGLELTDTFLDAADAADTPWLARRAGWELAQRLTPGCHVVVASLGVIYSSAEALLELLREWRGKNVTLHVVVMTEPRRKQAFSLVTSGEAGEATELALSAMQVLHRSAQLSRGAAISRGMQQRKALGLKYCRWPGYGNAWVGRKGNERCAPDEYEREVLSKVVEWKCAGYSWHQIAAHLLRLRIPTGDGRTWSESRVRRACLAALRSRATWPGIPRAHKKGQDE
jgi:hypothetical protein